MKKLNLKPKDKKSKIVNFRLSPSLADRFKKQLKDLNIKPQHFFEELIEAFLSGKL